MSLNEGTKKIQSWEAKQQQAQSAFPRHVDRHPQPFWLKAISCSNVRVIFSAS